MARRWISSPHFLLLCVAMVAMHLAGATVPAVFIFGDSTADIGTNNYLPECGATANFPFNGIDFFNSTPTGRFSNGLNNADQIVRLLGYETSPPPFLELLNHTSTFKSNILHGVNFASAGAGLLDHTGILPFKKIIPMVEQVQQFAMVQGNIKEVMGPTATASLISKSLFLLSVGSNDIFEYYGFRRTAPKQDFMTLLQSTYHTHLQNLFNLGARKFGIISVPPLGCCPGIRILHPHGGCDKELNELAWMFYTKMEPLLQNLSTEMIGMKYSLGNAYDMTMNIIHHPHKFNFEEVKTACCGRGKFNAASSCEPTSNLCLNRHKYLFWDRFHPTEAASKLAALTLYGGEERFVTPMNFSRFVVDA